MSTNQKDVELPDVCMKLIYEAATVKDGERRRKIAIELSEYICQPDGIGNLFRAAIDLDPSSQKTTTHNQRFIAIANIIACLPAILIPYENYCENIIKQLKPFLTSDNPPEYSTLACIIVKALLESHHATKIKNLPTIILKPIFQSLKSNDDDDDDNFCSTNEAILVIDRLLQNYISVDYFVYIFPNLFHLLVDYYKKNPSRLQLSLKRSLSTILNSLKPGPASCLIDKTIFHCKQQESDYDDYHIQTIKKVTFSLLEENELLYLEFFFHLLSIMWTFKDDCRKKLLMSISVDLMDENRANESKKLDLFTIISTNTTQCLELIVRALSNQLAFLKSDLENFKSNLESIISSFNSCLQILEVLIATTSTFNFSNTCLPVLESLILSFQTQKDHKQMKVYQNIESLINQIQRSEFTTSKNKMEDDDTACKQIKQDYESILRDLNDKLVPVRVHALVRLKQLILLNEPYIVSRITQIYPMIEASLADEEPYVFLACIKLVAEMSVRKTREILPKLIDLFNCKELQLQNRINVGEVLVQLIKQLNETTPYYAQQVMSVLIRGCQDREEELIRMSSLVNIGQLMRNLGDSQGKYMIEILTLIENILSNDTIHVKGASIDLLRTTLADLDELKVESIQRELKSIYKLLKDVKRKTLDDMLCLQVDLALDEIDRLARELLNVYDEGDDDGKLVKEIKVLSLL